MVKRMLIMTGVAALTMLLLGLTFLRPVPIVREDECLVAQGNVVDIEEGPSFDVIFTLHNDHRKFYINRGLETGLTLDELRKKILYQEVTIKYPQYSSPFGNTFIHLSKLEHNHTVVYSELSQ